MYFSVQRRAVSAFIYYLFTCWCTNGAEKKQMEMIEIRKIIAMEVADPEVDR